MVVRKKVHKTERHDCRPIRTTPWFARGYSADAGASARGTSCHLKKSLTARIHPLHVEPPAPHPYVNE